MPAPQQVEPDPLNFDTQGLEALGYFAGPAEHDGFVYVIGRRSDDAGNFFQLAAFKSNDGFVASKIVLDWPNGLNVFFNGANNVFYSKADNKFYCISIDNTTGPTNVLTFASFDIASEHWSAIITTSITGLNLGFGGIALVQRSDSSLVIFYINPISGAPPFPSYPMYAVTCTTGGVCGTPVLLYTGTLNPGGPPPRYRSLSIVESPQVDATDTAWLLFIQHSNLFPQLSDLMYLSFTSGGVGTVFTAIMQIDDERDFAGGPTWYVASLDTVVFPFAYPSPSSVVPAAMVHHEYLFLIENATTAPTLSTIVVEQNSPADLHVWGPVAFWSNTAETVFNAGMIWADAEGFDLHVDEQIWRWTNSSLTGWPAHVIDWDYNTEPPNSISGPPGLEQFGAFAPVYIRSETAYATLLTFFAPICPELYYWQSSEVPRKGLVGYHPRYWSPDNPAD